jgi:hypothetical protein
MARGWRQLIGCAPMIDRSRGNRSDLFRDLISLEAGRLQLLYPLENLLPFLTSKLASDYWAHRLIQR